MKKKIHLGILLIPGIGLEIFFTSKVDLNDFSLLTKKSTYQKIFLGNRPWDLIMSEKLIHIFIPSFDLKTLLPRRILVLFFSKLVLNGKLHVFFFSIQKMNENVNYSQNLMFIALFI